jgi:hypothetical protein
VRIPPHLTRRSTGRLTAPVSASVRQIPYILEVIVPGGKAYGVNRAYQVLCRDILIERSDGSLKPYGGDGIDVPIRLGNTERTFDVTLADPGGRIVAVECKRTTGPVKIVDLDAFAYRVELLRKQVGVEVAGVYFAKTAFQSGAVKAGADAHIQVATCAEQQILNAFALVFHRYDPQLERRFRQGELRTAGEFRPTGSLYGKVIRADGSEEDHGQLG